MINPHWLVLLTSTTNNHGPKGVRAIEVWLHVQIKPMLCFFYFRIFWFIVFGTLIYFLIGACMVQTERFLQYKTVTKTTINLEKKLTLPAVTICNLNLIKNDSVEDSETRDLLKNLYVPHPNVNFIESLGDDFLQNVSLRKIFVDGSPTESFLYCTLFLDIVDCNKIVTRKITETGYCHTFGAEEPKQNYDTQVTGVSGGVSFLVLLQQNNYFISEGFSAGIKVCFRIFYLIGWKLELGVAS